MVIVLALLDLVLERILRKMISFLASILDEGVPVRILTQTFLLANYPEHMPSACDRYIHSTIVFEESECICSDSGDNDDVFLTSLVAIDCIHLYISIAA